MNKKIIKSIILLGAFFLFVSWLYKVVIILLLGVVWRDKLKGIHKWAYFSVITTLILATFMVMPRFRYNNSDRVVLYIRIKPVMLNFLR